MKSALGLFLGIVTLASPGFAQTATGSWTLGPNWSYNRNISNIEIARIAMQGEINKRLLPGATGSKKAKKKIVATGPTSYKSTAGHLLPDLISAQSSAPADEKARIKQSIEGSIKFYENIALAKEYGSNDVAFALLYYLVNNYVIYRNIDPAATDVNGQTQYLVGGFYSPLISHEQAVYRQLSRQLSTSKDFTALGDKEKQQIAEVLAVYTTLMWHQFQYLAETRNMNGLGEIRREAASNVESFTGGKIETLDIGNNGIVIVK